MISCVYCGGAHARPADVKACWERSTSGTPAAPAPATPPVAPAPVAPPSVDAPARRGPSSLGRNVVVAPGAPAPNEWRDAERVAIRPDAPEGELAALVDAVRRAAITRTGLVFEVGDGFDAPPGAVERRPLHELGPGHTMLLDELHHLVWSNAVDARDPAVPRWRWLDVAVGLGATVVADGPGDVVLPDGQPAWIDGGPIGRHQPVDGAAVLHTVQLEHDRLTVPAAAEPPTGLAPDQLAAVTHAGGAARIIAPAGSGKTRVLTERARHLLTAWRLPPGAVTLVAFNKRAQEEMRQRTADLPGLQVRTLNSIALAILNGVPPFARQPRQWRTLDEPQVRELLGRFVATKRKRNTDPLAPWIDALSLARLGLVAPDEVEARYGGDVDGFADVLPHYRTALERAGAVDFDDQIVRAIELLLTDPEARRAAQRACRVLLVDEFQDLTPAHLLLVRLLAAPGGAVFGVGDDDQTIYGYNGADPAWLIDYERWFPGAGSHPLEVNYRCPAGVVEIADRLLRHNRRRVPKTIRPAPDAAAGGWSAASSADPVTDSVTAVRTALDGGATPADVAVLTRVNATIAPVQVALAADGVAISGGVGTEFADRTAVRAALAWLRLASGARFAPADLDEALRRPSRPLHPRIAEWVAEQRDCDGLLRLADRLTNERDAARVIEFGADIARLQALVASGAGTERVLATLIDDIGLGGAVATLDANRRGMNRAAQGDDLLALRQLGRLHDRGGGAAPFERWLRDHLAARRDPDGVTLATVHRVKGQEWPHVVVHLADADQFPHRLAEDLEEERRLFHVAITRARHALTIVNGPEPSPFAAELTSEPPAHPPEPAPGVTPRAAAARASARAAPDHPLLDRDRVPAVVGLVLVDQGHEWTITELEPQAAVAARGATVRRFPLGAKVETAGRQRGKLGPRPGEVSEASVRAYDLLRAFRERARNGKPAYTVFDDKTLAAIAAALPADAAELARVRGVGPAKLDQYGDDVLAVIATALA